MRVANVEEKVYSQGSKNRSSENVNQKHCTDESRTFSHLEKLDEYVHRDVHTQKADPFWEDQ